MYFIIIISLLTIVLFISFIIFKPKLHFGKLYLESFWIIALIGALILVISNKVTLTEIANNLFDSGGINPIKLLIIFISMGGLSIILDQLGFFRFVASFVLKKAGNSQLKIFIFLYLTVSILTIFTSNDIIILTFTPIIIYFAKHAKINPLPLLISEFVAANTWSSMLIIGNPTNIYLAQSFDITFIEYFKVMVIPTIVIGLFSFILLYLIFRKELVKKIEVNTSLDEELKNPFLVKVILSHLILCTAMLTIASYINIEMYLICLTFLLSALIFTFIYQKFVLKEKPIYLTKTLKNIPWNLIPFVISMFVLVIGLNKYEVAKSLYTMLANFDVIIGYGASSFIASNLVNNIPMSVLYTNIISYIPLTDTMSLNRAIYSTIIGSNLGAYLTPIGALAGIMWLKMLKSEQIDLSFLKFIKYGLMIAIPTMIFSLIVLSLVI